MKREEILFIGALSTLGALFAVVLALTVVTVQRADDTTRALQSLGMDPLTIQGVLVAEVKGPIVIDRLAVAGDLEATSISVTDSFTILGTLFTAQQLRNLFIDAASV